MNNLIRSNDLLFIKNSDYYYPIGYDKYHFLFSETMANHNNINVDRLKFFLHHELVKLFNVSKATTITNQIIPNKVSIKDKAVIKMQIQEKLEELGKQFPNKLTKINLIIVDIIDRYLVSN